MAALARLPPPRTPSPKIRIHRSQSFDSPSSKVSVTPIDDSPYSKSTGAITKPLPRYDAVRAAEQAMVSRNRVLLQTKMSDESLMSDASSASSSAASSPISDSEDGSQFGLFSSGSPELPSAPSPPVRQSARHRPADINTTPDALPQPPQILSSSLAIYQDTSVPMFDPWLVRVVLDMYDVRGFDWMMIAEPIERMWGFRTSSAEVLGILAGNGRIGRRWWD